MDKTMDLQYFLDNTPLETVNKLSDELENDNIENNAAMLFDLIKQVWEQETGEVLTEDIEEDRINKIFFDLQTLVAIYTGVRRGHMKITDGRLILSDPNNAKFSLTPRGIKHVETKLLKK